MPSAVYYREQAEILRRLARAAHRRRRFRQSLSSLRLNDRPRVRNQPLSPRANRVA